MTQQQFQELKSLIQLNAQGISRNYEMIGRIYEEHGGRLEALEGRMTGVEGRLTRVEVGQEKLSDDLRAVADGFEHLSASVTSSSIDHERRLRTLEN